MIGYLKGKITEKKPPQLVIEVSGIGYEVEAPLTTFSRLPELYQETILHTHLVVREDAHLLFGFSDIEQRSLFRALIKVNGIGPKVAIAILSSMEVDRFVHCVQESDSDSLTRLPGIGKKTAERLIIDMRDKLKDWAPNMTWTQEEIQLNTVQNSAQKEAIDALVSLGFKERDAKKAVEKAVNEDTQSSEELIRAALRKV